MEIPDLLELLEAGVHFGHRKDKFHPKMKPYVFTIRDSVCIIDLEETTKALEKALVFIQKQIKENKIILLVGAKKQAKDLIKKMAQKTELPYVSNRWLGGLLTNFDTIRKRLKKLKELKTQKEAGEFEKFTKKEQLLKDSEIAKLEKNFGGIADLTKLPDALFVVDSIKEKVAVGEARILNIPVIAICDTNADPTFIDYPIPANDDAIKSLEIILGIIEQAICKAKSPNKLGTGIKKEKKRITEKVEKPSDKNQTSIEEVATQEVI